MQYAASITLTEARRAAKSALSAMEPRVVRRFGESGRGACTPNLHVNEQYMRRFPLLDSHGYVTAPAPRLLRHRLQYCRKNFSKRSFKAMSYHIRYFITCT